MFCRIILFDHVGTIPKEFSSLSLLEEISLSNNYFTGTVSGELNSLTKLRKINLCDNRLSQTLPDLERASLLEFYVCRNFFTGDIPHIPGIFYL